MHTTSNGNQDPAMARAFFEDKLAFTTGPVELSHIIKEGDNKFTIVDVREADDFASSHVPGAINLPNGTWDNAAGLTRDKINVVYCYTQSCHLAAKACASFAAQGYPVMEMEGGFEAWKADDLEVEHSPSDRFKKAGDRALRRS